MFFCSKPGVTRTGCCLEVFKYLRASKKHGTFVTPGVFFFCLCSFQFVFFCFFLETLFGVFFFLILWFALLSWFLLFF